MTGRDLRGGDPPKNQSASPLRMLKPLILLITMLSTTMRFTRAFGPRIVQGTRTRVFNPNPLMTSGLSRISTTIPVMAKDELDMEIDNMIDNIVMEEVPPPALTKIETEVSV